MDTLAAYDKLAEGEDKVGFQRKLGVSGTVFEIIRKEFAGIFQAA